MKKYLITLMLALASMLTAAYGETVNMKDGSVYMGHTSIKNFDKGYSNFMIDSALVVVKSKDVTIGEQEKSLNKLSPKWQNWFRNHPEYIITGSGDNKFVTMCYLSENNSGLTGIEVVLLERGVDYYKYWTMSDQTKNILDADVASFEYTLRSPLAITGIVDELERTDGTVFRGQIVRESPKGIGIFTDNKVMEVVPYSQVRATRKKALYSERPIEEQVEYYDVLNTHNGENYTGIITAINYRPGDKKEPFYTLRRSEGDIIMLPFDEVKEIKLSKNDKYKPLIDIMLADYQAAINRNVLYMQPTKEVAGMVTVDTDSLSLNIAPSNPQLISAEFHMDNVKAQQLKLVKLRKYQDKKAKTHYYGFSFEDMVKNAILPKSVETSVNGISKIEYAIPTGATGIYGVYNPLTNKIVIFKIADLDAVG